MLKLTGAMLIGAACAMYGFSAADRLRRRRDFLNAFLTSLSVLETEIVFGRYPLGVIFGRIKSKELCGLFTDCDIESLGIRAAWDESARAAADAAGLKENELSAILTLGSELGMTDTEGQKKSIARTRELAAAYAADAADEYKRLGRAYRGCGIAAGIFFILMLI